MPNCPDLVLLFLAVTALGAAAAPLNPVYTETEFRFFLGDIQPRYFLIPAGRPTAAASAAEATSTPLLTVEAGDGGLPEVLAAGRLADIVLWDPARFGTTPELVLKSGFVAWGASGSGSGSTRITQPRSMAAREDQPLRHT